MAQPTRSDVHVNKPLTNISIAYIQKQEDFVADKVFPNVPVMKQSDKYFSYDKKSWFRTEAQKRADSSESAGSGFTVDNSPNYFCDVWAVHKDVGDQIRTNADQPLDMDRDATLWVTQQMLLRKEKQFISKYLVASTWTGSSTGSDITPSALWDTSTGDPMKDVSVQRAAIKKVTGYKPNTFAVAFDTHEVISNNATVLDRIKYTQKGIVTEDILAALLKVDKYVVVSAVEDTAQEGVAASMAFLFSKKALLVYANPTPSIMMPSGGYIFSWQGLFGAGAQGARVSSFRMEHLKADRVEGEMAFDMKLVGADLGAFFTGVMS